MQQRYKGSRVGISQKFREGFREGLSVEIRVGIYQMDKGEGYSGTSINKSTKVWKNLVCSMNNTHFPIAGVSGYEGMPGKT